MSEARRAQLHALRDTLETAWREDRLDDLTLGDDDEDDDEEDENRLELTDILFIRSFLVKIAAAFKPSRPEFRDLLLTVVGMIDETGDVTDAPGDWEPWGIVSSLEGAYGRGVMISRRDADRALATAERIAKTVAKAKDFRPLPEKRRGKAK